MKRQLGLLTIAVILAATSSGSTQSPFAISVKTQASTVAAGSPVLLTVTLKNTSDKPLDDSGSWDDKTALDPNLDFVVRNGSGRNVPFRDPKHPVGPNGRQVNRSLRPGESVTEEQDVARLYDFSKPGQYTIQITMQVPKNLGTGLVKSNVVAIDITK